MEQSMEQRGAYILREPKGIPDVILIARGDTELACKAANILAVQGYTARLVHMCDEARFLEQSEAYRESVLPMARRALWIEVGDAPMETARAALRALRGIDP